jgi:putative proteasome-type protease
MRISAPSARRDGNGPRYETLVEGAASLVNGGSRRERGGLGVSMTYCCGILVREGLVMIADTRTNAGLDNISTFRKLHMFEQPGRHVMMIAASGNLSVTQGAVNLLAEGLENPETGEIEKLADAQSMVAASHLVGRAVRQSLVLMGEAVREPGVSFDVTLLFGGQIGTARPRLFMVYTAGNAIECTPDTPYLQIGEHKYGKPILDRAITFDTEIYDALKIGLISMDSTIRSNLSVGLPIDIALMRSGALQTEVAARIDANDAYFRDLRERWSAALRAAHMAIPPPPYRNPQ